MNPKRLNTTTSARTGLALIWLLYAVLAVACMIELGDPLRGPKPAPAPVIPPSALILDATSFPTGWDIVPCEPNCDQAERSGAALRTFGKQGTPGHVVQEVMHFADENAAHTKFQTYMQSNLSEFTPESRSPYVPFKPPPEITYLSPFADEQYLGCGVDVVLACRAGRRYGSYFVYIYFDIDGGKGDGLQISEVEPILRALDERYNVLFKQSPSAEEP
jgi:hypothetical protein